MDIAGSYYSQRDLKHLYAFPFNRFDPDNSIWWLSPSSENPNYKYAKFGFLPYNRNQLLVGIFVEKGLGQDYCSIDDRRSTQRMVIDNDWRWHKLLGDLSSDNAISILDEIRRNIGCDPEIHVEGGYASPGFEPEKPRYNWDFFEFVWNPESQDLMSRKADHDGNVLGKLEICESLQSLQNELSRFTT